MAVPTLLPGKIPKDSSSEVKELRISNTEAGFMIGAAILFDSGQMAGAVLTAVPFIGIAINLIVTPMISVAAFMLFGIWFALKKVNYFGGQKSALKLISVFSALVIDFIPFLNALPMITGSVIIIIYATRIEDTVGNLKKLQKRLRARKFWTAVTNNAVVNTVTLGMAGSLLEKQYEKGSNRMAAQVAYGRSRVTKEEQKKGMESLGEQMGDIEIETPGSSLLKSSYGQAAYKRKEAAELLRRKQDEINRRKQSEEEAIDT